MSITYRNAFYNPRNVESSQLITTIAVPVEYKGFLIYRRSRYEDIWDIVKDGVCVGMYAGLNGAKRAIDDPESNLYTTLAKGF